MSLRFALFSLMLLALAAPHFAFAEAGSVFGKSAFMASRAGLFTPARSIDRVGPSLFVGRAEHGFFAERPAHEPVFEDAAMSVPFGSDVQTIRHLIGQAESPRKGYDAVQHGARIKPGLPPTKMTIAQIYQWIDATPGQPHAIGRYQFIPATLRRVVRKLGVNSNTVFSPRVQDRLADVLLAEAGLHRFRRGELGRVAFMNNLAKIWAGLPNSSGKSHYDGYAGNKATMTWAKFDAAMTRIAPG